VCISHCWLQSDHPDPRVHNLRVVARALEAYLACFATSDVAVLLDFCSMPGPPVLGVEHDIANAVGRFASEDALFKQALDSLGTLYSHPHTHVWMLTAFPPDYDDPQCYERRGNVAPYAERGWCFCEASWAAMVKDSAMVLDLGKDTAEDAVDWNVLQSACMQSRRAPMLPSALAEELARMNFTDGKGDRPTVARLYAEGFAARFDSAENLEYGNLGWTDDETKAVAAVLAAGAAPKTLRLFLHGNSIGDEGVSALAQALPSATALEVLILSGNAIGEERARALSGMLSRAMALQELDLSDNSIGAEGARALADALPSAMALRDLCLSGNAIGAEEAMALAGGLSGALEKINLENNAIGDEGARAVAEALWTAKTLQVLRLSNNSIGDVGARALAQALPSAEALSELYLDDNSIGDTGAHTLARALLSAMTLKMLHLNGNSIGDDGLVRLRGLWEARRR
jgi:hypothetical protein